MNRTIKAVFLLGLLPTLGQAQHIRFSETKNADGSVSIYGSNESFIPYTVKLDANQSIVLSSQPALPLQQVLFPSKQPKLLVVLTPRTKRATASLYSAYYQPGLLRPAPDTSYLYQFPLSVTQRMAPVCVCDSTQLPQNRFLYAFKADGTVPVRAARDGIVGVVRTDAGMTKTMNKNFVLILHEDGSYAYYENLRKQNVTVAEGQRVKTGDILGYFEGGKAKQLFWFNIQCPGPDGPSTLPVVFTSNNKPLRLR